MSIYSGFATRKLEENYNNLVSKLISLLQDHLIELFSIKKHDYVDETHRNVNKKMKKYYHILMKMQIL
jgi:hypothetical protein